VKNRSSFHQNGTIGRWSRALGAASLAITAATLGLGCDVGPETDPEELGQESYDLAAPNGLVGQYFDNANFTGTVRTRTDTKIDFNWRTWEPIGGMGADTFSVRWTGKVLAKYTETYRFYTAADDGVRLWVNGQPLVNDWKDHLETESSGTISLVAGQKYDIVMEYYDNLGPASARLRWSSPSTWKEEIPAGNLFTGPDTGTTPVPTTTTPAPTTTTTTPVPTSTTPTTPPSTGGPSIAGCSIFPANNAWNQDISAASVDAMSSAYINHIMANGGDYMHADFGSYAGYGIPFVVVPGTQPKVPMTFDYASESDPGPYPFPANAPIEPGSDAHVIVLDKDNCKLYETWSSQFLNPGWHAGSGAVWNLSSNVPRPDGWSSADAAGLPILPGLVRYEEAVTAKEIKHALRFTVSKSQRAYVFPATHFASNVTDPNAPPLGIRLRLKASFDTSSFTGASKVILTALKKYGMLLADNGANWFVSGTSNPGFSDADLDQLKSIPGTQFEVISTGPLHK